MKVQFRSLKDGRVGFPFRV